MSKGNTMYARIHASSLLSSCISRVQASVPDDCTRLGKFIDEADSRAMYRLSADAAVLETTFCI